MAVDPNVKEVNTLKAQIASAQLRLDTLNFQMDNLPKDDPERDSILSITSKLEDEIAFNEAALQNSIVKPDTLEGMYQEIQSAKTFPAFSFEEMFEIIKQKMRQSPVETLNELDKLISNHSEIKDTLRLYAPHLYSAYLTYHYRYWVIGFIIAIVVGILFIFSFLSTLTNEDQIGIIARCQTEYGGNLTECFGDSAETACKRNRSNLAQHGEDISLLDCDFGEAGIQ